MYMRHLLQIWKWNAKGGQKYCDLIQVTLSDMHDWSQHNNIRFDTSKCKALTVTRKKTPIVFDYTLDGTTLTRVSEERDLGVIITSALSWDSHIHAITAKANWLLGWLKRTCPLLTLLWMLKWNRCKQVDSTHAQRRDVIQGAVDYAWLTSTLSRSRTQRLGLFL